MSGTISTLVKRFGTDEVVPPPILLRAGDMSAEFEDGNLRHIRFRGVEVLRAISFIVRDRNWATYKPVIQDLVIDEGDGQSVEIRYRAETADAGQRLRYVATIRITERELEFHGEAEALTSFVTNRTGFVVLHPIDGVSGSAVTIERVDGSVEEGRFPELIDPVQPMLELRALTHAPLPGLLARCCMEGDTYEMEDQRNWTDASYKTYVRPLARPWPYTLTAGDRVDQKVSLTIIGDATSDSVDEGSVSLSIGEVLGSMPQVGVGLPPECIEETRKALALFSDFRPDHVIVHHDPRRDPNYERLADAARLATELGSSVWLEAVISEVDDFQAEVAALGLAVQALGSPFDTVLVSPAADLDCTLPGSVWPPAPDADSLYRATRDAFPEMRIGGGMFSYFTELNRKRPPLSSLDLVGFTTSAIVHAGDDVTVMENLSALPWIARSARAIAGSLPLSVGPSAIGMRMNPYGEAPVENPGNIRQAMNRNDPRQRGLFGAAWAVGYHAQFSGVVRNICFGATTGAHGLLNTPQVWPQPWYEEHGGYFPIFHVIRLLADWSGRPRIDVSCAVPTRLQAIGVRIDSHVQLLIANLTAATVEVDFPGNIESASVLDESHFEVAATDAAYLDRLEPVDGRRLELGPYALARVHLADALLE